MDTIDDGKLSFFTQQVTSSMLHNRFLLHYFKFKSYFDWATNASIPIDKAVGYEKAAQYARDISVYLISIKKFTTAVEWLRESVNQYVLSYEAFTNTTTDKTTETINTLVQGLHLSVIINHDMKHFFAQCLSDEIETNQALLSGESTGTTQYINQYRHIKSTLVTNNKQKQSHATTVFRGMQRPFIPVGPPYAPVSNIIHGLLERDTEKFERGLTEFIQHTTEKQTEHPNQNIQKYNSRLQINNIVQFEAAFYYAIAQDEQLEYTTTKQVLLPNIVHATRSNTE